MLDRPFTAANPLRCHHVGNLLVHAHGGFWRLADEFANLLEILLLPVHTFHQRAKRLGIKPAPGDAFKHPDQGAELRNRIHLISVDRRADGKATLVTRNTFEVRDVDGPAMIAEWVNLLWPEAKA